jgi:hypothetical protein
MLGAVITSGHYSDLLKKIKKRANLYKANRLLTQELNAHNIKGGKIWTRRKDWWNMQKIF